MGFAQKIDGLIALLASVVTPEKTEAAIPDAKTVHYAVKNPETGALEKKTFEPALPTLSAVSAEDRQEHAKACRAMRQSLISELSKLSASERRKAAALALAGASDGSVSATYAALRDGDYSASTATAGALQKGLELASAQKVALDAATW